MTNSTENGEQRDVPTEAAPIAPGGSDTPPPVMNVTPMASVLKLGKSLEFSETISQPQIAEAPTNGEG